MKIENIFKDIYKYYSIDLGENYGAKENLRQKKIKNKINAEGKKILQDIINIANGYEVVDWTDYESCCYEFKVLLAKNQSILDDDKELIKALNGARKDLRVFVSVLEPYYFLFVEKTEYIETKNKWIFNTIKNNSTEDESLLEKIRGYLVGKGYSELSEREVKTIVPNIQTDLKDFNEVQVFDCLFTDLVSII